MRVLKMFLLLAVSSLTLQRCASSAGLPTAKTFLEALQMETGATSYLRLVESAGGFANFLGKDKYTLVVPLDAAFSTLGMEKLMQLMSPSDTGPAQSTLQGHIAKGTLGPDQLSKQSAISLMNGKTATVVSIGDLKIGGATVVKTIKTKDGYVHFVNALVQ